MKHIKNYLLAGLIVTGGLFTSCGDDDAPAAEDEEEVIDLVTLTFTPVGGGTPTVVLAEDPDGDGVADFETEVINLDINTTYDLSIKVENSEEAEYVTEEIKEDAEAHQFFFAWTEGVFSDPSGTGNISPAPTDSDNTVVGSAEGIVEYQDFDDNQLPLGLETQWVTSSTPVSDGGFRIVLKHQPGIKSATTTSNDDSSDIDLTWTININD